MAGRAGAWLPAGLGGALLQGVAGRRGSVGRGSVVGAGLLGGLGGALQQGAGLGGLCRSGWDSAAGACREGAWLCGWGVAERAWLCGRGVVGAGLCSGELGWAGPHQEEVAVLGSAVLGRQLQDVALLDELVGGVDDVLLTTKSLIHLQQLVHFLL